MTANPTPEEVRTPVPASDHRLGQARTEVLAEMARADAKAGALLTVLGLPLAILIAAVPGRGLPAAALVMVAVGTAGLAVAMSLALAVIRPRLGGAMSGSYLHWATCTTAHEITADLTDDHSAAHIALLSRMVRRKYTLLHYAIDITAGALGALFLALVLALVLS
ncbi:Pycsar system effector family protein [Streptomyces erythrochromogenes]|uniref:Pycsar system effector family protein n=1 Tax=Streptomyces erythrochromogenes TaxID=285574 RepID=UPI0036C8D6CA